MAKKNIIEEFGGGVGEALGSLGGLVFGGLHAGAKYIETGDSKEAGNAFTKTGEKCIKAGREIGEIVAPGVAAGVVMLVGKKTAEYASKSNQKKITSRFMDENSINNPTTNSDNKKA